MLNLPTGYVVHGYSNNGNTLTAVKQATSTAAKPILLVIDRSEATYNQGTGKFSVPVYRVRFIRGVLDSDGKPVPERLLVDANYRTPIGTDSEHAELHADFTSFIGQNDFVSDGLGTQLLPDEPAV